MTDKDVVSSFTKSECDNIAIVKRLFCEVWNNRQLDIATELFSPVVVLQYDQGELKGIKNWEEKFYRPLIEALPDVHIEIEEIIAHQDLVITRWRARGTHSAPLYGVHPTGETIECNGTSWMKLLDGKIVAMWTNWNVSYLFHRLLSEVKELREIIPICMHCKGIRDDKGYWKQLENYFMEHSSILFSHGICDKCMKEYYSNKT